MKTKVKSCLSFNNGFGHTGYKCLKIVIPFVTIIMHDVFILRTIIKIITIMKIIEVQKWFSL